MNLFGHCKLSLHYFIYFLGRFISIACEQYLSHLYLDSYIMQIGIDVNLLVRI